jgi:hypothetical protein
MKISDKDLERLLLLSTLCEKAVTTAREDWDWNDDDEAIEDSAETVGQLLRVIGIVSTWLSADFKRATDSEIMWNLIAAMQYAPELEYDQDELEMVCKVASDDMFTLQVQCDYWLKSGKTIFDTEGEVDFGG